MNASGVLGAQWIVVDVGRILRLPDRLLRLWPRDLLPAAARDSAPGSAEDFAPEPAPDSAPEPAADSAPAPADRPDAAARSTMTRAAASAGITVTSPTAPGPDGLPAEVVRPRDLDVLSAWLAGFAAELNLARSRITLVVGAAREAVHLELAVGEGMCLAMLALRGAELADFAGFQFLRRLDLAEVAAVCEDLSDLIAGDCVLTLSSLGESGRPGMEFLNRTSGTWSRPLLERDENGMTVAGMEEMPDGAVRMLIASMLTRLTVAEAVRP